MKFCIQENLWGVGILWGNLHVLKQGSASFPARWLVKFRKYVLDKKKKKKDKMALF